MFNRVVCFLNISICIAAFCFVAEATAEVYKWVDEKGNTHFGDQPPPDQQSESVDIKVAPAMNNPSVEREDYKRRRDELLKSFDEKRQSEKKAAMEAKEKQAETDVECQRARKYQERYKAASRIYSESKDGSRRFLDEEERKKAEARLNDFIRRNCKK